MTFNIVIDFKNPFRVKLETVSPTELSTINLKLDAIIMKLSEALTVLSAAKTKLDEASTEILAKLEELKSTDPDISPEGVVTINGIASIATALSDVVPGTPTPPEA